MDAGERVLWERREGERTVQCVMRSCCAGAELQVRVGDAATAERITLRELYPTKSDLYERARHLGQTYSAGPSTADLPGDTDR